jgi:hypothetical protein
VIGGKKMKFGQKPAPILLHPCKRPSEIEHGLADEKPIIIALFRINTVVYGV